MEILNVMVAYFDLFLDQNIWYQIKVCNLLICDLEASSCIFERYICCGFTLEFDVYMNSLFGI